MPPAAGALVGAVATTLSAHFVAGVALSTAVQYGIASCELGATMQRWAPKFPVSR